MYFLSPTKMAVILLVYLLGFLYSVLSSDEFFADQKPRAMTTKSVVCETVACKERAKLIMSSIDNHLDPCDDFYSYVCKKTTTEMQGNAEMRDQKSKLAEDYKIKVQDILDSLPSEANGVTATQKLLNAYQACLHNALPFKDEVEEFKNVMSEHGFHSWPIVPSPQSPAQRFKSMKELVLSTPLDELLEVSLTRRPGMETSFIIKLKPKVIFLLGLIEKPSEDEDEDEYEDEFGGLRAISLEPPPPFGGYFEEDDEDEMEEQNKEPPEHKNKTEAVITEPDMDYHEHNKFFGKGPKDTNKTAEDKPKTVVPLEDKNMFLLPLEGAYITGLPETRVLTSAARILKQYDSHKITGSLKRNPVHPATRELRPRSNAADVAKDLGDLMMDALALFSPNATHDERRTVYNAMVKLIKDVGELKTRPGAMVVKKIKEVEKAINGFPLLGSLNKYLMRIGVTLQEDDAVMIINAHRVVHYLQYLMNRKADDVFNTFGLIKAFHLLSLTSKHWREQDAVKKYLAETGQTADMEELCVDLMQILFPDVITMLYVKKHFDASTRPMARELLNVIGKAYYNRLAHTPWMDHDTWMKASNMLWNMKPYVAHSEAEMDPETLNMRYKNVNVSKDMAFVSILDSMHASQIKKEYSLLLKDFEPSGYEYPNYPVHSAYFLDEKHIGIGAGMLQGTFFHKDLPMAANLGGIGVYMANKIAHQLNYHDLKMSESREKIIAWWSNYTMDAYQERATCFVKQYDRICEPLTKMKLNGTKTLTNNIIDHVSVKISFEALRNTLKESNDMALPGLEDLTPEKLFFISFALPSCMNVTHAYLNRTITMSDHAPSRYRINVPLMNMREFSAAFHCKRRSPMRPSDNETCTLW